MRKWKFCSANFIIKGEIWYKKSDAREYFPQVTSGFQKNILVMQFCISILDLYSIEIRWDLLC
jgi:hypothetical protein